MNAFHFAACGLLTILAACNGPDREPGDDPRRSDETPMEGRPKSDAAPTPPAKPPESANPASATDPGGVIPPPAGDGQRPGDRDTSTSNAPPER